MARKRRRRSSNRRDNFLGRVPSSVKKLLWGAVYGGVVKQPIEALTRQISSSVGLNVADNILRIGGLMAAKQLGGRNMPLLRDIADAGLAIEGGEAAAGGFNLLGGLFQGNPNNAAPSNTNNQMQVIG